VSRVLVLKLLFFISFQLLLLHHFEDRERVVTRPLLIVVDVAIIGSKPIYNGFVTELGLDHFRMVDLDECLLQVGDRRQQIDCEEASEGSHYTSEAADMRVDKSQGNRQQQN